MAHSVIVTAAAAAAAKSAKAISLKTSIIQPAKHYLEESFLKLTVLSVHTGSRYGS